MEAERSRRKTEAEPYLLRAFEGLDPRRFGGFSGGFLVASFTCCEHLKGWTLAASEAERRGCCGTFLGVGTEATTTARG